MCVVSVKELEEALEAEESMDKEVELRQEKVWYNVNRSQVGHLKVITEGEDEGESRLEEEHNEPMHCFGLLAKAQGKCPTK